jgi:hypothetical protein
MTVRELINILKHFNDDMQVRIGIRQTFGSDFAMNIGSDITEYNIESFRGTDYKAVVLTEGSQCGTVNYSRENY